MARTTEDLVKGIIEVDAGVSVLPFMLLAEELVTELLAPLLKEDGTTLFSDVRLELIERWLSAHFLACQYPRVSQETAGPVSATYQQRVGLGLELTAYGQQVKLLDTSGTLAQLDAKSKGDHQKRKAKVYFVGNDPREVV